MKPFFSGIEVMSALLRPYNDFHYNSFVKLQANDNGPYRWFDECNCIHGYWKIAGSGNCFSVVLFTWSKLKKVYLKLSD